VALRDRERWADAVEQADQLRSGGDRLPIYVRQAEADALLALRRPAEAYTAYNDVIEAQPQNQAAKIGRFFTEVEMEDFDAAFVTIDKLAAAQTRVQQAGSDSESWPNPAWLGDQVTAALARSYGGMNAEAWSRLNSLAEQAPGLGYLRKALGNVAASRGWPRRAAEEVEIAATLSPLDLGGQVALADSALWMKEYDEARKRADGLALMFPENAAVQRLVRDVGMVDRWEMESDSQSYNEGVGILTPNSPGSGYNSSNRVYSPLLGGQWRLIGAFDYTDSRLPEGFAQRFRYGAGIEWRRRFLTLTATGFDNRGLFHRGGGIVTAEWQPTDHWNLSALAALFSWDTPTRALFYGITANKFGFDAGYDWNESSGFAANIRWLEFSSGNRRLTGGLRFVQKLVNRPHLNVTVSPEIYSADNTKQNEPYFNPARNFAFHPAVDIDHTIWRKYERSVHQHVHTGAGSYWQRGYGTGFNVTDSYELIFHFNAITDLRGGVTYTRRIYDGAPVDALSFALYLTRRF
jgi:biofilm PGA synthesis protein PgaA